MNTSQNLCENPSKGPIYSFISTASLGATVLGKDLQDDDLEILAFHVDLIEFEAGATISDPNVSQPPMMVLIEGSAVGFGLRSELTRRIETGSMIGEVVVAHGVPRPMAVVAQERCKVAVLSAEAVNWLYDVRADIVHKLIGNIGNALRADLRSAQIGTVTEMVPAPLFRPATESSISAVIGLN